MQEATEKLKGSYSLRLSRVSIRLSHCLVRMNEYNCRNLDFQKKKTQTVEVPLLDIMSPLCLQENKKQHNSLLNTMFILKCYNAVAIFGYTLFQYIISRVEE